ncbi:hypothetical protein SAMN04488125_12246 [Methylorubrum salsuginis]|uniref:Uncharacterized protein n=1 Tax=Methylorubrum salsuginis TaxID=414703 RepID=A0A1I4K029_9HYPH|nr:hypothetical protein SAMN04488125_12246 [Methylorubrum salsuginis]
MPDETVRPTEGVEAGGDYEILEGREGDAAAPGQGIAGPDLGVLETRCHRLDQRLDLPLPLMLEKQGRGPNGYKSNNIEGLQTVGRFFQTAGHREA